MTTDNKQSVLTDEQTKAISRSMVNRRYPLAFLSKLRGAGRTTRQDALRISGLPDVDDALCTFCNDSTGPNAVALVQAILDAEPQALPSGHKPEPVDTSSGHSEPMSRDWKAIEAVIDEYLDGYELRLDEGCHRPTEFERFLIDDAIAGLLAENEFLSLMGSAPQASAEAVDESCCANCGKPASQSDKCISEYPEEGEWFCSDQCYEQHGILGCPHETHIGYRHPAESARLIAAEEALKSAPAAESPAKGAGDVAMPPLPDGDYAGHLNGAEVVFHASQMRAYVLADRQQRGGDYVAKKALTFIQWWVAGGQRIVSSAADLDGWRGAAEQGYIAGMLSAGSALAANKADDARDALRYRWLREASMPKGRYPYKCTVRLPRGCATHDEMDTAIDTAIGQQANKDNQ